MPHFSIPLTPGLGPTVRLVVGPSIPRAQALHNAGMAVPAPIILNCLIDTGAHSTCLDTTAIAPLGLSPTGKTLILTPSTGATPEQRDNFDVSIGFYHKDNSRIFGTVPIIATDFSTQSIDGLIGRDILESCLFVYDGAAGIFAIAF